MGWYLNRLAEKPEYFTDPARRRILQRLSAIGLILYILTVTFASIDWIMSLQPEWFSSIFGLLIVTGQVLAGMAFALVILPLLTRHAPLSDFATPDLYRDLGALLLSMVVLWAYMAFSQYLIIWSGNIPREVTWYVYRSTGGWLWIISLVIAIQFILPFLALLSLRAKRNLRLLASLSLAILVARLIDYFWIVMPAFYTQGFSLHWIDFGPPLAIGAAWIAIFIYHLKRTHPALITQSGLWEASDRETEHTPA
jgi:hypothetical protein